MSNSENNAFYMLGEYRKYNIFYPVVYPIHIYTILLTYIAMTILLIYPRINIGYLVLLYDGCDLYNISNIIVRRW